MSRKTDHIVVLVSTVQIPYDKANCLSFIVGNKIGIETIGIEFQV
jgi:hypothetical protein